MLLHGIFPPITTPFYPDGNVYFKKLESNVERYSRTPCAGIVALGSTGEAGPTSTPPIGSNETVCTFGMRQSVP